MGVRRLGLSAAAIACQLAGVSAALAQTAPTRVGNWIVHVDAAGVFKNASAEVYVGGARVPGGSIASVPDATVTFDAAYFLTPQFAVDVYAGLPPRAVIRGANSLSGLGTLATTNYGPAVLSFEYHPFDIGGFHPFVAVGVNYTLFLNIHNEALYDTKIPDNFGAAFKVGLDYDITPRWTANFYAMTILLGTRVSAFADPAATIPAVAKATINPTIIGFGVGYRF
jgi:outer membrane protein